MGASLEQKLVRALRGASQVQNDAFGVAFGVLGTSPLTVDASGAMICFHLLVRSARCSRSVGFGAK
jgi:hypothetical protein